MLNHRLRRPVDLGRSSPGPPSALRADRHATCSAIVLKWILLSAVGRSDLVPQGERCALAATPSMHSGFLVCACITCIGDVPLISLFCCLCASSHHLHIYSLPCWLLTTILGKVAVLSRRSAMMSTSLVSDARMHHCPFFHMHAHLTLTLTHTRGFVDSATVHGVLHLWNVSSRSHLAA